MTTTLKIRSVGLLSFKIICLIFFFNFFPILHSTKTAYKARYNELLNKIQNLEDSNRQLIEEKSSLVTLVNDLNRFFFWNFFLFKEF